MLKIILVKLKTDVLDIFGCASVARHWINLYLEVTMSKPLIGFKFLFIEIKNIDKNILSRDRHENIPEKNEPAHEIMVLISQANNEGSGENARAFAVAHIKYGSR